MVLCLKTRESRSPPGLPNADTPPHSLPTMTRSDPPAPASRSPFATPSEDDAGWSSPVARQAHNLKAAGSNPAPATTNTEALDAQASGAFVVLSPCRSTKPAACFTRRSETVEPYRSFMGHSTDQAESAGSGTRSYEQPRFNASSKRLPHATLLISPSQASGRGSDGDGMNRLFHHKPSLTLGRNSLTCDR